MASTDSSLASRDMGKQKGGGEGSWSDATALTLTFYDEIMLYYRRNMKVAVWDGGMITEVLGKGLYKVKLQFLGSVVTAKSQGASTSAGSGNYLKGAYALILIESATNYIIMGVRQTGSYTPRTASEYEV